MIQLSTILLCSCAALAEGPALAPAPLPPATSTAPSLDFDLLGQPPIAAPPEDPAIASQVGRRRTMLTLHQGLGIATWTALAATVAVGQLDFDDRFRGGGDTGRWHGAHRGLAFGSATLFAGTALLALLAPEPYAKRSGRLDTATLHKVAMGATAAGMVAQVVLGLSARRAAGHLRERDLASAHQTVGYATLGAMTAGGLVLLF